MKKLAKLYVERQNLINSVHPKDQYEFESILTHNIRFGTIHLSSLIHSGDVEIFDECVKIVLNCIDQFSSPNQLMSDTLNATHKVNFDNAEPICHFLVSQYINLWVYANEIKNLDSKRAFIYLVAELRSTFNQDFHSIIDFKDLSIEDVEDIVTIFMENIKNENK